MEDLVYLPKIYFISVDGPTQKTIHMVHIVLKYAPYTFLIYI